jgi:hypothetical protein
MTGMRVVDAFLTNPAKFLMNPPNAGRQRDQAWQPNHGIYRFGGVGKVPAADPIIKGREFHRCWRRFLRH